MNCPGCGKIPNRHKEKYYPGWFTCPNLECVIADFHPDINPSGLLYEEVIKLPLPLFTMVLEMATVLAITEACDPAAGRIARREMDRLVMDIRRLNAERLS